MRFLKLALVLALAACSAPTDPIFLTLRGTVRSERTGEPVPGAHVALVPQGEHYPESDVVADAQGRYSLSSTLSREQCERTRVTATVDSWSNAGVTPMPERPPRCTARTQAIDVVIRFEPF